MSFLSRFTRVAGALGAATLLAAAPAAGAQLPVSAAYAPSCGPGTSCETLVLTVANPLESTLVLNSLNLFSTGGAFLFAEDVGPGVGSYGGQDDFGPLGGLSTVGGTTLFIDFTDGGLNPFPFSLNPGGSGFVEVQLTGTPALQAGVFSYVAGSENDVTFRGTVSVAATAVVPEPSTYLLMATGLGVIGLAVRRRRVQN